MSVLKTLSVWCGTLLALTLNVNAGSELNLNEVDCQDRIEALDAAIQEKDIDSIIKALSDRRNLISRYAQRALIAFGDDAIPKLVDRLIECDQDEGFYATIVEGIEGSRRKSLAGTLWLTLVQGLDYEQIIPRCSQLSKHPHPKVRAVALFVAMSMRNEAGLALLESLKDDPDPLVQRRLNYALAYLFVKPGVNADLETRALTLISQRWLSFVNGDPGRPAERAFIGARLWFDMAERSHEPQSLPALVAALEGTAFDVRGCGVVADLIARWDRGSETVTAWMTSLSDPQASLNFKRRILSVLSFPSMRMLIKPHLTTLYQYEHFLSVKHDDLWKRIPNLAANMYASAATEHPLRADLARRLYFLLTGKDKKLWRVKTACALTEPGPVPALNDDTYSQNLKKELMSVRSELLKNLESQTLMTAIKTLDFFLSLTPQHQDTDHCMKKVLSFHNHPAVAGWHDIEDAYKRYARTCKHPPYALALNLVEAGPEGRHHKLRDGLASWLVLQKNLDDGGYMNQERFKTWISILDDPQQHPRLKASLAPLVAWPGLNDEQREMWTERLLRFGQAPFGGNLQSKCLNALAQAGDQRAKPLVEQAFLEWGHPGWTYQNLVSAWHNLHLRMLRQNKEDHEQAAMVEACFQWFKKVLPLQPEPPLKIPAYPNNYFHWGISYQVHVPAYISAHMRKISGQKFSGLEMDQWQAWIDQQKASAQR